MTLDDNAIAAAFAQPDHDGGFAGDFGRYLRDLGGRRPLVLLAFPPKAAGTFLRSAAIDAVDGQLVRLVHAQGDRDAQLYLPTLIAYFTGKLCPGILVAHVHMQALKGNRGLIEALGLKPVAMLRAIPDMLASYWDMLDAGGKDAAGLNCPVPENFPALADGAKADFLVDMLGPWYAGYYATWLGYKSESPQRVCLLDYADFRADAAGALAAALAHAGVPQDRETCEEAVAAAWQDRHALRFNHGERGRGAARFSAAQKARLRRMLGHFAILSDYADRLVGA